MAEKEPVALPVAQLVVVALPVAQYVLDGVAEPVRCVVFEAKADADWLAHGLTKSARASSRMAAAEVPRAGAMLVKGKTAGIQAKGAQESPKKQCERKSEADAQQGADAQQPRRRCERATGSALAGDS